MRQIPIQWLLSLAVVCAPLSAQETPANPSKDVPKEAAKEAAKPDAKDPKDVKPKTIDETVKDYEKLPGVLTLYRKLDNNKQKLLLELNVRCVDPRVSVVFAKHADRRE